MVSLIYNLRHYFARQKLIREARSHGFRFLYIKQLNKGNLYGRV